MTIKGKWHWGTAQFSLSASFQPIKDNKSVAEKLSNQGRQRSGVVHDNVADRQFIAVESSIMERILLKYDVSADDVTDTLFEADCGRRELFSPPPEKDHPFYVDWYGPVDHLWKFVGFERFNEGDEDSLYVSENIVHDRKQCTCCCRNKWIVDTIANYAALTSTVDWSGFLPTFVSSIGYDEVRYAIGGFVESARIGGLTGLQGRKFMRLDVTSRGLEEKFGRDARLVGVSALVFSSHVKTKPPRIVDAPNRCPYCNGGFIVCIECGYVEIQCTHCRRQLLAMSRRRDDPRPIVFSIDRGPYVLRGSSWSGDDFCGATYPGSSMVITKRALEWLLATHAEPFKYRPCRVAVEGMTKEQLEWLDRARRPLPALGKK